MNAIKKIVEDGLKENEKELKNKLMELENIKEIISQNKNFSFDIKIFYNKNTQLLELTYILNKDRHEIELSFQMPELMFNFHCIDISVNIIKYAISYLNETEFKVNVGDYDGDIYVGIKEYIDSFYNYDEDKKSNIFIVDKTLRKEL